MRQELGRDQNRRGWPLRRPSELTRKDSWLSDRSDKAEQFFCFNRQPFRRAKNGAQSLATSTTTPFTLLIPPQRTSTRRFTKNIIRIPTSRFGSKRRNASKESSEPTRSYSVAKIWIKLDCAIVETLTVCLTRRSMKSCSRSRQIQSRNLSTSSTMTSRPPLTTSRLMSIT